MFTKFGISATPESTLVIQHRQKLWGVAFGVSRSGRVLLASGSNDGTVHVHDTTSVSDPPTLIHTLSPAHGAAVRGVAFGTSSSHDPLLLATCSKDGTVKLWSAEDGFKLVHTLSRPGEQKLLSVALGRTVHEQRLLVAAGAESGSVYVWDLQSGEMLWEDVQHTHRVVCVQFHVSAGTLVLASGSKDRTVRVREASTGSIIGRPVYMFCQPPSRVPIDACFTAHMNGPNALIHLSIGPRLRSAQIMRNAEA